jgi:hypothetical protein
MGINQSTEWTISYMTSFISSFFMIGPIINFIKINLIKKLQSSTGCLSFLLQFLMNPLIKKIITNLKG